MSDDNFIASGIEYYAEALRTTAYFRKEVERRLRVFAEEWQGSQRVKREPSQLETLVAPSNSATPWIVCRCPTRVDGELAGLEVGLWWITPDDGVAYASFTSGPEWLQRSLNPRAGREIRLEKSGSLRHFVCKIVGGDLESGWARLLDELVAAVERGGPTPTP